MTKTIPHLFADVTAKLEDLHAVAVEGQRADNSPDIQAVLNVHLRDGVEGLGGTMRALTSALKGHLP